MNASMRSSLALAALLASVIALVAACQGNKFDCDEETPCDFGSTCISGFCIEATCATSQQCPIEQYCAPTRQCVGGCEADTDCLPGSYCDTSSGSPGECAEAACVDSHVDCGFREFCNTATGECYDAGDLYCRPCEPETEAQDCGEGNVCFAGYCGVDCTNGRECPSGFECYPFVDSTGQPVTYQCITYCWLYDEYDDGSFVQPPPPATGPLPLDGTRDDIPGAKEL